MNIWLKITTMEEIKYYLYRHIRLDKYQPFYIGIGTIYKKDKNSINKNTLYRRAFSLQKKSNIWKKISNKTEYKVEIMIESNDYNFIKQKEIEFIKLYGRIDLNNGILSNLTNGGEGTNGVILSDEFKYNCSQRMKGIKFSEETKRKMSESRKGIKCLDETKNKISKSNKGKIRSIEIRNKFSESHKGIKMLDITREKIFEANSKKVIDINTNIIYDSIKLAAKCINIPYTTLIQYLKGKNPNKTTLMLLKDFQKWQK